MQGTAPAQLNFYVDVASQFKAGAGRGWGFSHSPLEGSRATSVPLTQLSRFSEGFAKGLFLFFVCLLVFLGVYQKQALTLSTMQQIKRPVVSVSRVRENLNWSYLATHPCKTPCVASRGGGGGGAPSWGRGRLNIHGHISPPDGFSINRPGLTGHYVPTPTPLSWLQVLHIPRPLLQG